MPVTAVRITDPYLLKQIEAQRAKHGESTATTTARRLLIERLTQIEPVPFRQLEEAANSGRRPITK